MADRNQTKDNGTQAKTPQPKTPRTPRSAADLRQRDLASDIQGRNRLQGNDQEAVRNQRRQQPKVGGATGRSGRKDGED